MPYFIDDPYDDYDDEDYIDDDSDLDYDDESLFDDPAQMRSLFRVSDFEGYEPGFDSPVDQDSLDVLNDGSLVFTPSGEESDPSAYSITTSKRPDMLAFRAAQESEPVPDVEVGIPGIELGIEPSDAVEPRRVAYQLSDLSGQFELQPPVQDKQNVQQLIPTDVIPEAQEPERTDIVNPQEDPNFQALQEAYNQRFSSEPPYDPNAVIQEQQASLDIDSALDPRTEMLAAAYGEETPPPIGGDTPSTAYIPGTPIPENVLFGAWDTFQQVVLPALGDVMATLGESTQVTTPFVREIMNIQTGVGTVAELGVKGRIAIGATATGPAAPAIWTGLAAQTLATAPISQVVAEDLQNGNYSQALDDILGMGAKIQQNVGRALELEQEHWDNLVNKIGNPTIEQLNQGNGWEALKAFRKGIRDMAVEEEENYARRKSEGEDPGWFTDFISDVVGTPQLGVINKIPGVNKLIDLPFNAGSKALHGKFQTPHGYGQIMGRNTAAGALDAMANSSDDAIRELYASHNPEAAVQWFNKLEPALIDIGRKKKPDLSALSPQEQEWVNLFSRADMDGVREVVRNSITNAKSYNSVAALAEDMERSVLNKVRSNRELMDQQWWEARNPVLKGLHNFAEPMIKGYENIVGGVGRAMSVMYLVTASYLAGNPAESFARTMLGGGKPGMMSTSKFRDMAAIFSKNAPLDLGAAAEARTPFNVQRSAFLDKIPGMAKLEHWVLDTANQWEVKIRRHSWANWAADSFENRLKSAPKDYQKFMSLTKSEVDNFVSMLPRQYRDDMKSTLYFSAAGGQPALMAMRNKMERGEHIAQAVEEVAEKFQGLPQNRDQVIQFVRDMKATGPIDQRLEALFGQMDDAFRDTQAQHIAARSGWWENEIVAQAIKDIDEIAAKNMVPTKESQQQLADAVEKIIQIQLGDSMMGHYIQVEKIMNNPYYRPDPHNTAWGKAAALQRRQVAEAAHEESNDYLALATLRNQQMMQKLAPALEANGMGTVDDVVRSFATFSDGMKNYYKELTAATENAWQLARDHKIPWGRPFLEKIASNKAEIVNKSFNFLQEAQAFIDRTKIYRTPRAGKLDDLHKMIPDDYAGATFDVTPQSLWGHGGSFSEATAAAWDDLKAFQEEVRALYANHPLVNPDFTRKGVEMIDRLIANHAAMDPKMQAYGGVLLGQAADDAGKLYRLNFPVYDDLNQFTYMAQTIFPFFRYEAFRWPYLARAAGHNPQLTHAWFEYWEDSDQGYSKIPRFRTLQYLPLVGEDFAQGEWQWFPIGGTVFGGARGIARPDFAPRGGVDKAAYNAIVEAPDLEPWEKEWLKRPVLRDVVMARRLGDAYEAASQAQGQYLDNPDFKGLMGAGNVARQIAERYGFYPNILVSSAMDSGSGFAGEALGPVIKGGLNLAQQIPRDIPVAGGVGDVAYAINSGPLKDSYALNQVGHALADQGLTLKTATPEQIRKAWNDTAAREIWSEQIAGMRYRSQERQQFELDRDNTLDTLFGLDDLGQRQREAILNATGAPNIKQAQQVLRSRGERLEDVLGKVDPNLAMTDDQRAILRSVDGSKERQAASEPFQSEEDKVVARYFNMLNDNTTLAQRRIDDYKEQYDTGRITITQLRKAIQKERSEVAAYNSRLGKSSEFDGVQERIKEANLTNQLSYQDQLERDYFDIISQNSSESGVIDFDGMRTGQREYLNAKQAEAMKELERGNDIPYRAFVNFKANLDERMDKWWPGMSKAVKAQQWLDDTVPRFDGVQPGDPLNDKIRDSLALYREYSRMYPKQGLEYMLQDVQKGRVTPQQYILANEFKNKSNKLYPEIRRQLYYTNKEYRNWFGLPTDPDEVAAQAGSGVGREKSAAELIDQYIYRSRQ